MVNVNQKFTTQEAEPDFHNKFSFKILFKVTTFFFTKKNTLAADISYEHSDILDKNKYILQYVYHFQ